jgi:hypothetical protein
MLLNDVLMESSYLYYDKDLKQYRGSIQTFLKKIHATMDDVRKAISIVKQSEMFKRADEELGYVSSTNEQRQGILVFKKRNPDERPVRPLRPGKILNLYDLHSDPSKLHKHDVKYAMLAKGQDKLEKRAAQEAKDAGMIANAYRLSPQGVIRTAPVKVKTGQQASYYNSPLKQPKVRLVAGNPVQSLVNIYTDSIKEILSKKST